MIEYDLEVAIGIIILSILALGTICPLIGLVVAFVPCLIITILMWIIYAIIVWIKR